MQDQKQNQKNSVRTQIGDDINPQQLQQPKVSQQHEMQQIGITYSCQPSSYQEQYTTKINKVASPSKQQLIRTLQKNGIKYTNKYVSDIKKFISLKNQNSLIFSVRLGYFELEISMLKVHKNSADFQRQTLNSGSFATIYKIQLQQCNYAVKSQHVKEKDRGELNQKIDQIFTQFIHYKVASILGIGPTMKAIFGYDVVCFNDRIEFAMQLCEGEEEGQTQGQYDKNAIYKQLLKGMKIMHSIRMVHRDIKQDNIGYSRQSGKWVYLDYGFAKFIRQGIGQRTYSNFIGTYKYTNKQLKQIFHLKKQNFVDFYHNDLHGLQMSIQHMNIKSKRIKKRKIDVFQVKRRVFDIRTYKYKQVQTGLQFGYYCWFMMMKYHIFKQQVHNIVKVLQAKAQMRQIFMMLIVLQIQKYRQKQNIQGTQTKVKINTNMAVLAQIKNKYNQQQQQPQQLSLLQQQTQCMNNIKVYITKQEVKQIRQIQEIVLYFDNDQELSKYVKDNWNTNSRFMGQVFMFMYQAILSNSNKLLTKLNTILNIIMHQHTSTFMKFMHVIYQLQGYFMSRKEDNMQYLQRILYLYEQFNDYHHHQMLQTILTKQMVTEENQQKQVQFNTQELMNHFRPNLIPMGTKQQKQQTYRQMEQLSEYLNKTNGNNYIIKKSQLKGNEVYLVDKEEFEKVHARQKHRHKPKNIKSYKFFLEDTLNNRIYQFQTFQLGNFQQMYQRYPFREQLPFVQNIEYHLIKGNIHKSRQLQEDALQLWKHNIEVFNEEIIYLSQMPQLNNKQELISKTLKYFKSYTHISYQNAPHYVNYFTKVVFYYRSWGYDNKELTLILSSVVETLNTHHQSKHKLYVKYLNVLLQYQQLNINQSFDNMIILYKQSISTNQYSQAQKHTILQCLAFFAFNCEMYSIVDPYIIQIWENRPKLLRCWLYQNIDKLLLATINALTKLNRIEQTYELIKQFTNYLTKVKGTAFPITHSMVFFTQLLQASVLCLKTTILNEKYCIVTKNDFHSAFILLIYLHMQTYQQTKAEERKKILTLCMSSLSRFPSQSKPQLRDQLLLRYQYVKPINSERKATIYLRKYGQVVGDIRAYQKRIQDRIYDKRTLLSLKKKLKKIKNNSKMEQERKQVILMNQQIKEHQYYT